MTGSAPEWVSYVGAITGVGGFLLGIVGTVLGVLNHKRVNKFKRFDLRLEIRRLDVDIESAIKDLPGLMGNARQSRLNVAAAMGMGRSGATEAWIATWDIDQNNCAALESQFRSYVRNYSVASDEVLEEILVQFRAIQLEAQKLSDRYKGSLEQDARDRDRIAASRVRTI